ncbi:MAG: protocatechuate 3,4-dioxygenase subunit alpha [Pseudomonadota bacterium]
MKPIRPNTRILSETASQTAGPYVHIGLSPRAAGFDIYEKESGPDIAGPNAKGERIRVEGIVCDGNGEPVKDILIEVWQPNSSGVFADQGEVEAGFRGWGRIVCDFDTGEWSFDTVKPGAVGPGAPHLSLWLVARGINTGLHTRMYFDDLVEENAADPVLSQIDAPERRATLLGQRENLDDGTIYRFDIRLQGEGETVFFDI